MEKDDIPSRIQTKKAIQVSQSGIAGAGRGMFAKEDIKAGELIFCIPQPLIIIVDPEQKTEICDNCFAVKRPLSPTVPVLQTESLKLSACGACKLVYYCSKKCQAAAWEHHHKLECSTFRRLKECRIDKRDFLDSSGVRGLVRLLLCRNKLSFAEWAEFEALSTNRELKTKDGFFEKLMECKATILKDYLRTTISREEIMDLYCALINNQLGVLLPVCQGSLRLHDAPKAMWVVGGICLEPFASLLNHSCIPTAVWIFNGQELRVRASRNIFAGEELTISYTSSARDYEQRNGGLLKRYGFTCTCDLCKKGMLGQTGVLRDMALRIIDEGKPTTTAQTREVEVAILALNEAGFGIDNYPMRLLHQMLLLGYIKTGNDQLALKKCLQLYYFIEPVQTPPMSREERLETLHSLYQLLDWQESGAPFQSPQLLRNTLYFHIREKFVLETERCFGADSIVARFERGDFEEAVTTMSNSTGTIFIPIKENESERSKVVAGVNRLLKMAGLPERTEREVLFEE